MIAAVPLDRPRRLHTPPLHPPRAHRAPPTHTRLLVGGAAAAVPGWSSMASIPQTLHLTKSQRKQRPSGASTDYAQYYGNAELDQPMRYSSKLMNSIWGHYNENSVHNFKSLQCGGVAAESSFAPGVQQQQQQQQEQQQQQQQYQQLHQYQQQQQQLDMSPSLARRGGLKQRLGDLGEAVAANFMDNLNQYY